MVDNTDWFHCAVQHDSKIIRFILAVSAEHQLEEI